MELPVTVDLDALTLENFQSVTGHRFRMTKDQKSRAITRQDALTEFIVAARQARAATPVVTPTPAN